MTRILTPLWALLLLAIGCKQKEQELPIFYYSTNNTHDIVKVEEPAQDADIRNIIFMIGDGMGLEQVSCAWVLNHGKLNLDNMPVIGLIDLDGDGQDELVTIEPFHGNSLNVYKQVGQAWQKRYTDELWFGHGLSCGMFRGEPVIVVGNRRGPLTLNLYRRLADGSFAREILEEQAGPTQTQVFTADGKDYILSANQLKNEVALYY